MITIGTWQRGIKRGMVTTWELTKVVVPIYMAVTFLKYTPLLHWIARVFAPVMKLLGLPGEASLAIVLGNVLNIYAAIGVITGLNLNHREITIIAVVLLLSHTLFVETAVARRCGLNGWAVGISRFTMSLVVGMLLNIIL